MSPGIAVALKRNQCPAVTELMLTVGGRNSYDIEKEGI